MTNPLPRPVNDVRVKAIGQFDSGKDIPFPFAQPSFKGLPLLRVYYSQHHREYYAYERKKEKLISFCHPDVGVLLLDSAEERFQKAIWSDDGTRRRILVDADTFWRAYRVAHPSELQHLPDTPGLADSPDCWL